MSRYAYNASQGRVDGKGGNVHAIRNIVAEIAISRGNYMPELADFPNGHKTEYLIRQNSLRVVLHRLSQSEIDALHKRLQGSCVVVVVTGEGTVLLDVDLRLMEEERA